MNATEFCHVHRVTYAECTLGNHVYYGHYLAILEAARGEFFRHLGESCLRWQQNGLIFPVVECSLRFLAPARYDDVLRIRLWLDELRGPRLSFVYRIEDEQGRPVLEGTTSHVCTTLEEKPRRLPPPLTAKLAPHVRPTTATASPSTPASP